MTDAEWAAVRPLLPVPAWLQGRGGRPEGYCHRQVLDAIRYLVAGGISWRALPADFPGWGRVYAFFRRWREHGLIAEFHDRLRGKVREHEGREAEPTAGIIDAQSVRAASTVPAASRGYDGGKKVPAGSAIWRLTCAAWLWPSWSPRPRRTTAPPRVTSCSGCG
ncbi:transposase [Streptomyces monashensis]|uniref:transposase n=1 Tax=Streptomyces monashensis TaxID=1678012 RepID=UPI003404874F